jgi:hypothetical protein
MKKDQIYFNDKYHMFNSIKKRINNLKIIYDDFQLKEFCFTIYDFTISNIEYFLEFKILHPIKLFNDILFRIKTQEELNNFINSKELILNTYDKLIKSDLHNWLEPTIILFDIIIFYDPSKKYTRTVSHSPKEKRKKTLRDRYKFGKIVLDDYDNLEKDGIYRFYNINKELIYVGKGYVLSKRLYSSALERNAIYYDYCIIGNKSITDLYEIYYITKLKPILNNDCNHNDILSVNLPELIFTDIKPLYDASDILKI